MYLIVCIYFAPIEVMCLNNCKHSKDDSPYKSLVESLNAEITNTSESCEYLETDSNWSIERSDLLIMQLNVRGLSSKTDQIKRIIGNNPCNKPPEVILLCETWLNRGSPSINIPGYNLEKENRTGKKGGGVAILIKEDMKYKSRPDLRTKCKNAQTETCFVELKGTQGNVILGSLYHLPNTPVKEFIDSYTKLLSELNNEKHELILGMDHNLDLLKINHHKKTEEFLECNLDNGMIPQITKPTRITQTSATLIDNVMISKRLCGQTESHILIEDISDHMVSLVTLRGFKHTLKEGMKVFSRDTRKNNIEKLKMDLQCKNWDLELKQYKNNLDVMTERFQRILGEAIDHFTPYRERTISHKRLRKEKWMTGGLMNSINKGRKQYKKSISEKATDQDRKKYRNYMLVLRKVKRYARKKYYLDRCVEFKANTRELWKTINQVIGRYSDKSTCISELKTENLVITRQKDITNELGKFFSTVGENFANNTPNQ